MTENRDPKDPNSIYYREPSNPKYQVVFPWGAGGNLVRHLIGLHPDQELLDQDGKRINSVEDKFENLMTYQYPLTRSAKHWLNQEWQTRHLYNCSKIEHWPPASDHSIPAIFIEPDLPRISIRLYQLKNPGMNGWGIKFGVTMNKKFRFEQMPEQIPSYRQVMVIKFSELLTPIELPLYNKLCLFLGLVSKPEIYDMCQQVHTRWIKIQELIWAEKYKMSLQQWVARERRHQMMLDSRSNSI